MDILWDEKLRKEGAKWVQKDNFWLFGTLTFYEQRKGIAFEDERQRQLRFLFNALDRNLLPRRFTHTHLKKDRKLKECYNKRQYRARHKAKFRLERVVYDELGKGRHLSHAHFFIKGTKTGYKLSLPIFTGPCLCLGNGGPLMANKRARPEDIITKLRQVEVLMGQGMSRLDAIRQIGVVEQTYYRWRKQYGGMGIDQLKELKRLQKENEQLRRAVSDLTLDKLILKEAAKGNF